MENYVLWLKKAKRRHFTKLRISCHHLAIKTGRYTRLITPRNKRLYRSCSTNTLGDEFHFLLICPNFNNQCKLLFTKLYEFYDIKNYGDHNTLIKLMHCCHGDVEMAILVCNYITEYFTLWCPSTMSLSCYQVNYVTPNFYAYIVFYCLSHFGLSFDVCWLVCVCVPFIACQFLIYISLYTRQYRFFSVLYCIALHCITWNWLGSQPSMFIKHPFLY